MENTGANPVLGIQVKEKMMPEKYESGKGHESSKGPHEGKGSHFGQHGTGEKSPGAKEAEEGQKGREAAREAQHEARRETGQHPTPSSPPASNPPVVPPKPETHAAAVRREARETREEDAEEASTKKEDAKAESAKEKSSASVSADVPPVAEEPPPTGLALISALRSDFVPPKVLEESERWLRDHPDATAVELYQHMEAHQGHPDSVTLGTLRKAGKFAYGDTFEPEQAILQGPGDELRRLRAENAQLHRTIEQRDAKLSAMVRQLDAANQERNDAVKQFHALETAKGKDKPGIS